MSEGRYQVKSLNNSASIPRDKRGSITGLSEIRSRAAGGGPAGSVARSKSQIAYDEVGSVTISNAGKSRINELKSFRGLRKTPEIDGRTGWDDTNSILRSEYTTVVEVPC